MLPQVLAGLGALSVVNGACLFWLERMQPVFFAVAVASLLYEIHLVRGRPSALRKRGTKAMLTLSLALNALVVAGWILVSVRYR